MMRAVFLVIGLFVVLLGTAQSHFTLSGTVADSANGETLIGATVVLVDQPGVGAACNEYGYYALRLPAGTHRIRVASIGYAPVERIVELQRDVPLDIKLRSSTVELKAVEVTARRTEDAVHAPRMGVEKLDMKEVNKLPVIFGEKDILKTLQLLPGVKSIGEGNGGLYVRGGAADENLVLLDEAPVYNAYHLLGFFSTFNSDAVKDVTLYKGTSPAQYGGRLSSVIDVRMKEGSDQRLGVSGGIGLIASRLSVEGPIVKERGSFLVTGRRTYADLLLKLSSDEQLSENQLYFYDVNAKANYRLGAKDRLYLSGYLGRDQLAFGDRFGIDWGNVTGTLRWNHVYGPRLFSNTSAIISDFSYNVEVNNANNEFSLLSRIRDLAFKHEFSWYATPKHTLRFGLNVTHHTITPGEATVTGESGLQLPSLQQRTALDNALFIHDEWKATQRLQVGVGLRLSAFNALGGGDFYSYNTEGEVTDTTRYNAGEFLANYIRPEPRLTLSYQLTELNSLKLGYARNVQVMHLISNTTSTSPTDVWLMSSKNIAPRISDQVALGWSCILDKSKLEFTAEAYYKLTQNALDLRNGADLRANEFLEGELLAGEGRAYGLELLLRKREGRFTGWVGYTLARTELRFDEVNDGAWYSAKQDATHDISLVGMYDLNDRWQLSATWVYRTGNAVTFPSGKYEVDGEVQFLYTERNGYRMPAYHRLDLAATWSGKKSERSSSSWSFGLYNAYGRENAYSIDFEDDPDDPSRTRAVQTSLFKWVPSITYNFSF